MTTLVHSNDFVALVIGNQDYPDAPLANPRKDAIAVARAFNAMGYDHVDLVTDANTTMLDQALDEFNLVARDADVAIIYYAGHGLQIDGRNYLVPIDVTLKSPRDVRELTTQQELTDEVAQARQFGLVILDACRDNPFASRVMRVRPRSNSNRGLTRDESAYRANTLVAYATASDDIAADGMGFNSPYTSALLSHLSNAEFDVYQLFGKVRDDVVRETDGEQMPYHYGSTGGQRYFLHPDGYQRQRLQSANGRPVIERAEPMRPISASDLVVASSRFQTFKRDLEQQDWSRLLDSRSLSVESRQRLQRWRGMSDRISVSIQNLRARESTQTVYADIVVSGVGEGAELVSVEVVRDITGTWSTINW